MLEMDFAIGDIQGLEELGLGPIDLPSVAHDGVDSDNDDEFGLSLAQGSRTKRSTVRKSQRGCWLVNAQGVDFWDL